MKNNKNSQNIRRDIELEITEKVIDALEHGTIPWKQPWIGCTPACNAEGKPYSLLNQLILMRPGRWLTFNKMRELGGHLREGFKSEHVLCPKTNTFTDKTKTDEDGNPVKITYITFFWSHALFNAEDIEGLPNEYYTKTASGVPTDLTAEKMIEDYSSREKTLKINIINSSKACYNPNDDAITVPDRSQYSDQAEYYSTLFHEITHSTAHPTRCDRPGFKVAAFGDETYSKEELIAEMGAATLVSLTGLEVKDSVNNSIAYITHWLEILKKDKTILIDAAKNADKSTNFVLYGKTARQN